MLPRRFGALLITLAVAFSAFMTTPALAFVDSGSRTHAVTKHEQSRHHARHARKRHHKHHKRHRKHHKRHVRSHATRVTVKVTTDAVTPSAQLSASLPPLSPLLPGQPANPLPGGLTWLSGASSGTGTGGMQAFGSWRGQASTVASMWPSRQTWYQIAHPDGLDQYAGFSGTLSIGVPMLPDSETADFASCAQGAYDTYFAQMGTGLVQAGRGDSFVRLGWEFNGDWFKDSAANTDSATWVACWRHEVTALRSTDPAVQMVWNGSQQSSWNDVRGHLLSLWPGDSYVDVVGVDYYDQWPVLNNEQAWDSYYNQLEPDGGPTGLGAWLAFAEAHGKKLALPEWGVSTAYGGGGDDPFFIAKMFQFFATNASHIAYECYFDDEQPYWLSGWAGPSPVPNSAAEYRLLF